MFEHILLATDFSEHSTAARNVAAAMCESGSHRLSVLTVYDPAEELPLEGVFGTSERAVELTEQDLHERVSEKLDEFCEPLTKAGLPFQKLIKEGSVDETIVATARELGSDLIVIGSHSRQSILDIVLGSTTAAVVKDASCPVLVAALPHEQRDSS